MATGKERGLQNLPLETLLIILHQSDFPVIDLRHLREVSKDLTLAVNQFVMLELIRLKTQGPSTFIDFFATQEPVTSANAWAILSLFKKAYASFPLDVSIEKGCQQLNQATMALKEALVLQNPQHFADLGLQETAQQIRTWFSNPINHPLLQNVTELILEGKGLSVIPTEVSLLSNLKRLSLSENQITKIPPKTFANLPNLQSLSLRKNQLTVIDPRTFTNLSNLVELDLQINQLTEIKPETFAPLVNLQHLYLCRNELRAIAPQTFTNLVKLQYLFLRRTPITVAGPIDREYIGLRRAVKLFFRN